MKTIYEYATKSWPVVKGCDESLPCAARCWAKRQLNRLAGNPNEQVAEFHDGLVENFRAPGGPLILKWTGTVKLNEAHLADPLRWRKPQVVAVGYHGDIALLSDDQIRLVMSISASASEMYGHTMLFLTKRPGVLWRVMLESEWRIGLGFGAPGCEKHILPAWLVRKDVSGGKPHPKQVMPNLWFGVSITNQADADERIPLLLQTPAAHRWLSIEPMVGPVDLYRAARGFTCAGTDDDRKHPLRGLDQLVLGGESGPGARPMHPDWVRSVRDQCAAAGVPFFFKQWGEWLPGTQYEQVHFDADPNEEYSRFPAMDWDGENYFSSPCQWMDEPDDAAVFRVGKKLSGHRLDGKEHRELAWEVTDAV